MDTARLEASFGGNLVESWIPSLEGVEERLRRGARVAGVGCGDGASTLTLARAFPASRFHGVDHRPAFIAMARAVAVARGLAGLATFEVVPAHCFRGDGYDLVCLFDGLCRLDGPEGAARCARASLAPGGTLMVVEPIAGAGLEDELDAREAGVREVLASAGFTRLRRAAETPFHLVFEARP